MTQSSSDQRRPFLSAPSPQRYFAAGAIEDARLRIVRAIARSEGPAILVGGAGTGKSLLLAVLAEQFAGRMAVVTLAGAQLCTRRALLQMILFELGLPYRDMDEGELRLAILGHLKGAKTPADAKASVGAKPQAAGVRRLLLLVDEADTLPIRLLEELRVLTNVAAEGLPLVSLVLAGGPILEERFADPALDMFSQRIAARCYLAPLGREETLQYVRSQVAAVGVKPEKLFKPDALEAIHAATGGVPRLVNQLGDQLVWMAEETGCAPLDATLVQQAWSDLQQLPAPWDTADHPATASSSSSASVIEFGELDAPVGQPFQADMPDDESPASIPIATGRLNRAVLDIEFSASVDATDDLVDSFDAFDDLELHAEEADPAEESATPAATNPFDERFDDEEIVLDPYSAFESELLRTAPQVINRLDRAFAGELHRCVQREVGKRENPPAAKHGLAPKTAKPQSSGASPREAIAEFDELAAVRLHQSIDEPATAPAPVGELLLIEDDDASRAAIIPARQFRRLFSALESTGRSHLG
jgi:type II secretory pathway predicted ATPase ExeA